MAADAATTPEQVDHGQTRSLIEDLLAKSPMAHRVSELLSFVSWGNGAPTVAPAGGRGLYMRLDGAPGTNYYLWNGVAWGAAA